MNTFEIENVMKNFMGKRFLGVFPSDFQCLPNVNTYPSCFISNSDPCHENGTHWIAIYVIDKKNAEFFDSFGMGPMSKGHKQFLKNYNYIYNIENIQSIYSDLCGLYSIYYLINRVKMSFNQFLKIFKDNKNVENDSLIVDFFTTKL